jgi:hypothetical protein
LIPGGEAVPWRVRSSAERELEDEEARAADLDLLEASIGGRRELEDEGASIGGRRELEDEEARAADRF